MTSTTFKALVDTISATGARPIRSRSEFFTESSGLTTMERFLKGSTYITKMVIGKITASSTLSWLTHSLTPRTTYAASGKTQSSDGGPWKEFQTLSPNRWLGIALQKVVNGIEKTASPLGLEGQRVCADAACARSNFSHFTSGLDSAPKSARTKTLLGSILTDLRYARSAAKSLWQAATHSRCIVVSPARRLPCTKSERVFDLTLLEHNAYYANGVLVANCGKSPDLFDALAIGVEGARQRGFLIDNNLAKMTNEQKERDPLRKIKEKADSAWKSGALNYSA